MINIAEILKKCSKGTKLYSPICGECELHFVGDNLIYVKCDNMCYGFNPDGTYRAKTGECLLFPSKENRDWNKFIPFKDWDVIYTVDSDGKYRLYLLDTVIGNKLYTRCSSTDDGRFLCTCEETIDIDTLVVYRLATEEEKSYLFQSLKDSGYKWNSKIKVLEKLVEPNFKDGDIVYTDFGSIAILKFTTNLYYSSYCGLFSNVFKTDVIVSPVRFATEKEKKILFDAIKANGYKWNHETRTLEKLLEPRFKIGDWIIADEVHQDYHICQITDIDDNKYYIESIEGYKGFNYFDAFEKLYRQWTIQDAKDGDVLTTDMVHFIFKSKDDIGCYMHCDYSVVSNKFEISDTATVNSEYVHPATKEQRDVLFQKMNEAGYELDAEKKELNEIEPKSAWSEEDEIALGNALWCCKQAASIAKDENDMGNTWYAENWLKSLKDRCTWKPSNEQIMALRWVLNNVPYNKHKEEISGLLDQIKEL